MVNVRSSDGTDIICTDEGAGPVVIVVHGGSSDESAWAPVAAELTDRFRVIRIRRRLYRLELPADPVTDVADEVADVLAVAADVGQPCVLVGHSSGAVVALETLVSDPSPFAGAALYEPPLRTGGPLGGPDGVSKARRALDRHQPGLAFQIHLRQMVGMPAATSFGLRMVAHLKPTLRGFVPRQIDDTEAINLLGVRLDAYARIDVPTLLITGTRTPEHLIARTRALAAVLPRLERVATLQGQAHGANQGAPVELARVIAEFSESVLDRS